MFTSSAEVFRTRQAAADLLAYARTASPATIQRLTAGTPGGIGSYAFEALMGRNGRFQFPDDDAFHSAVTLAAALPDDDFPAFVLATGLLVHDVLTRPDTTDNLFWNWEAFHAQYALADPPIRAALICGFRAISIQRNLTLIPAIDPDLAFVQSRDQVLAILAQSKRDDLIRLILSHPDAATAGAAWVNADTSDALAPLAFRYLYERTEGIAPTAPESAPLLPWSTG